MADKSYTYTGNPGYDYPTIGLADLQPGDKVTLSDDVRRTLGDEFTPAAPKSKDAKSDETPTDAPEGADTEEP